MDALPRLTRLTQALARALGGDDLAPEVVADAFWLAAYRGETHPTPAAPTPPQASAAPDPAPSPVTPPAPPPTPTPRTSSNQSDATAPVANVYPAPTAAQATATSLPFRPPAGRALPHPLQLARILRPLRQRRPSPHLEQLAEDATAERIAETGVWWPVLEPQPIRWLELALVVDDAPSMALWAQTVVELTRLLEQLGAFRDVRRWQLHTSDPAALGLRAEKSGALRHPQALLNPAQPRLILLVSDGMAPAWHGAALWDWLAVWGRVHPVGLVQVLPQRLWPHTRLHSADFFRVSAAAPASPNQRLAAQRLAPAWLRAQAPAAPNAPKPVPILSLEPSALKAWVRLVLGAPGAIAPAVLGRPQPIAPPPTLATPEAEDRRLQSFMQAASKPAFTLARYLAAAPLRLPIMRLVQQVMLPASDQSHLAEFLLSGLIRRTSPPDVTDPEEVDYDFVGDLRTKLLEYNLQSEAFSVLNKVSDYIETHYGSPADFAAALGPAAGPATGHRYFAQVRQTVLAKMGSRYLEAAQEAVPLAPLLPSPQAPQAIDQLPELLARCRAFILQYDALANFEMFELLFATTEELRPFRQDVRSVAEREALVAENLAFLAKRLTPNGQWALLVFLVALRERYFQDSGQPELNALIQALRGFPTSAILTEAEPETIPATGPATGHRYFAQVRQTVPTQQGRQYVQTVQVNQKPAAELVSAAPTPLPTSKPQRQALYLSGSDSDVAEILRQTGIGTRLSICAYDTGWVAHLGHKHPELGQPALEWLRANQLPDGTWGATEPLYYHDRLMCTLSAMLALVQYGEAEDIPRLQRAQASVPALIPALSQDLAGATVGFEMLAPHLLKELANSKFAVAVNAQWVQRLTRMRQAKLAMLPPGRIGRQVTLSHSLEMLAGTEHHLIDADNIIARNGSVGCSPAATAFWVKVNEHPQAATLDYLHTYMEAGGIPTVAPVDNFEMVGVLWNLTLAGIEQNQFRPLLEPIWDALERYWQPGQGLSAMSPFSCCDVDTTAMAHSTMTLAGRHLDLDAILRYESTEHFIAYPLETQASISANIHTLEALINAGLPSDHPSLQKIIRFLGQSRLDGAYWFDKQHISPYYPTAHGVVVCARCAPELAEPAVAWLLESQRPDGSWGFFFESTAEETAYCIQALCVWRERHGYEIPMDVLKRGADWLLANQHKPYAPLWIGKGLYCLEVVVASAIVSALMLVSQKA